MSSIDWESVFIPTLSLGELILRGSLIYLALFLFLRVLPKREMGGIGMADVLVIVLISDAAQNAMSSDYRSITEGVVLVLTILFWSLAVDWIDHKFPRLGLNSAQPLPLIKNGRLLRKNMDKEQISEDELLSQLRQKGLESPRHVKRAYIEGDGHFSVIVDNERLRQETNASDSRR